MNLSSALVELVIELKGAPKLRLFQRHVLFCLRGECGILNQAVNEAEAIVLNVTRPYGYSFFFIT